MHVQVGCQLPQLVRDDLISTPAEAHRLLRSRAAPQTARRRDRVLLEAGLDRRGVAKRDLVNVARPLTVTFTTQLVCRPLACSQTTLDGCGVQVTSMVCRALDGDAPILKHLLGEAALLPWLFGVPECVPARASGAPTQSSKVPERVPAQASGAPTQSSEGRWYRVHGNGFGQMVHPRGGGVESGVLLLAAEDGLLESPCCREYGCSGQRKQ